MGAIITMRSEEHEAICLQVWVTSRYLLKQGSRKHDERNSGYYQRKIVYRKLVGGCDGTQNINHGTRMISHAANPMKKLRCSFVLTEPQLDPQCQECVQEVWELWNDR